MPASSPDASGQPTTFPWLRRVDRFWAAAGGENVGLTAGVADRSASPSVESRAFFAVICGGGDPVGVSNLSEVRPLLGAQAVTLVPPGTWAVDPGRSTVGFDVRHLKLTKVRGRFRDLVGVASCDREGRVSISGLIDVASIDTGDPRRDARLRDEDFFDVTHHPTIAVSASLPAAASDPFTVRGTMTIRGAERPLELRVDGPPAPVNGNGDLRIRAHGALSRRAFGLDWDPAFTTGGLVIDDRVALQLDVVMVRSARLPWRHGAV